MGIQYNAHSCLFNGTVSSYISLAHAAWHLMLVSFSHHNPLFWMLKQIRLFGQGGPGFQVLWTPQLLPKATQPLFFGNGLLRHFH